jgi:hypothetical protein
MDLPTPTFKIGVKTMQLNGGGSALVSFPLCSYLSSMLVI